MKISYFLLLITLSINAQAATIFWTKPLPVADITYTKVFLYCQGKEVGSVPVRTTRIYTNSTTMNKSGVNTCYVKSAGYLTSDIGKNLIYSIPSKSITFKLVNGTLVKAVPLTPTGLGIK